VRRTSAECNHSITSSGLVGKSHVRRHGNDCNLHSKPETYRVCDHIMLPRATPWTAKRMNLRPHFIVANTASIRKSISVTTKERDKRGRHGQCSLWQLFGSARLHATRVDPMRQLVN